jgi:hypothetical protein
MGEKNKENQIRVHKEFLFEDLKEVEECQAK